ncbi:MAG: SusC/RagA family TonB-linked outer membrane protein [Prevotellaceae bacterium]|nr:SusC/RagA family TonB-linked outer membrane protein [Prevotellaceae bacterium]
MKRLILLSVLAISYLSYMNAETIKSRVVNSDNSPVKGAIVSVIGEKATTLSADDGTFDINVSASKALVSIKAEGFYEQTLPLQRLRKARSIVLIPESESLYNGRVVTPYAEQTRENKLSGTSAIEKKDFTQKQNVGAALHDFVAGMQVIEKSGMPGEGSYINIRGVHSLVAENNPLIVINGVPYMPNQTESSVIPAYSRDILFGYSPRDIKSVTVLKGADAAFYGSLGSNGVIEIETEKPSNDNLNTRISFSGQYGLNFAQKTTPVLDASQYKNYMKGIGLTRYSSMNALTEDYPFLSNASAYNYDYLFNENTDWMKEIQRNGFTTENIFRVEGGDEIAKYNISFGYTGNKGTLKNIGTDRYHTLISSDVLVSRKVDIFANVGLAYQTSNLLPMGMTIETNPLIAASQIMPLLNPYQKQIDGSVLSRYATYDGWNTNATPTYGYDNVSNPLAIVNTVEAKDKIYDANANIGLNFKWNIYLTLTAMANLYYNYTEEKMFLPGVTDRAILPQVYGTGHNKVANGVIRQVTNQFSLQAKYDRTFNLVHEFNALANLRYYDKNIEYDISEGYNTANDYYRTLDQTVDEKDTYGSNVRWKYLGMAMHADYIYNKVLKASAGVTFDGTSVTGADASKIGVFPSAGVTFMAHNLGTLPQWINLLNISIEGSLTGNSRFSSNYGKNYYVSRNLFNIGAMVRSNVPNTELSWEKNRQIELGIDLSMFRNRFDFGANFFINRAYDLLINSDISSVFGSYQFYDNRAEISGRGIELATRIKVLDAKDFGLILAANASFISNEVKKLGDSESMLIDYKGYNADDAQMMLKVGEKPYEFYGYETRGVYATEASAKQSGLVNRNGVAFQAGDVIFVDQNSDGIINDADKVSLGSARPSVFGGVNLQLRYKDVTLDANFAYSVGNKAYNATRRQLESMDKFYNQSTAVLNRWQVEGQITSMPRAAYGDPAGNNSFSDRWIENADYFKCRSIKLAYNFKSLFSFIRSGSVYLAAENLFTLTKYLGSDPEFAYSYDEALRGFDYAKLALPRTVKVGFNLNF